MESAKSVSLGYSGSAKQMSKLTITDQRLKPIAEKVFAGERLNVQDGITLYRSPDLLAVGWLANHVREQRHGNVTYFNVNRHINPTNVCVAHCKLCAFGRDPSAPGAYTFALEEIYQRAEQGVREGATEFHIVGGLHPDLSFDYFLELIRGLGADSRTEAALWKRAPESVHDGRSGLFRANREAIYPRHAGENERSRRGFAARRGRGDFSSARAQNYLRSQSERANVVEHRAAGARNRLALERHHAVRPRGNRGRTRRSLGEAAGTAGSDAWICNVHSSGVSSR